MVVWCATTAPQGGAGGAGGECDSGVRGGMMREPLLVQYNELLAWPGIA